MCVRIYRYINICMYTYTYIHTCSVQLWTDFLFNCFTARFAWRRLPAPPHQPQLGPKLPSSPTVVSSTHTHLSPASSGQCQGETGVWESRAFSQDSSTSQGLAQPSQRCVAGLASRTGLGSSTPEKRLCAAPILGHEPSWAPPLLGESAQRPWPPLGPVCLPPTT